MKLKKREEQISSFLQDTELLNSSINNLTTAFAGKEQEVIQLRAQLLEETKTYQEAQKRAEQNVKNKVETANAEAEKAKMDLAQFKKDGKDVLEKSRAKLDDMRKQRDTNRLELAAAVADRTHAEGKVSGLESNILTLQEELEVSKTEMAEVRAENSRLLALRSNPQAERDRVDKAVREAVAAREVELKAEMEELQGDVEMARGWAYNADIQVKQYSRDALEMKEKIRIWEASVGHFGPVG